MVAHRYGRPAHRFSRRRTHGAGEAIVEHPAQEDADEARSQAERIYEEWDAALASNDTERLLALYAPDAVLESPLIPHLLGGAQGICRGHHELRCLFQILARRKPPLRQHHRQRYFTDGHTLVFEYPRAAPGGEQMDFVEVMHLAGGLITYHKVYWGWLGVQVLQRDEYRH
jgi:hypothetical protein